MQINRLFEIVYLLLDRKKMTSRELAERFEVSTRTILRDIDTLAAAKIPIYTLQGKGGGVAIMENFVLSKAALTENEQMQILIALQSLSATGNTDAGDVLSKLSALFQKTDADWIEVDFSGWGHGAKNNSRFNLLKNAILNKMAIEFQYVSSNCECFERRAYPLKLVFKSKAWYLQGFCLDKQDYRTFRLSRMLGINLTRESFVDKNLSPPPIEAAQTPLKSFILIELEFSSRVAYRVYDEFDEDVIDKSDCGTLHVLARMPEDNWLYSFLMSFGNDVCVLHPQHVKEKLANKFNVI